MEIPILASTADKVNINKEKELIWESPCQWEMEKLNTRRFSKILSNLINKERKKVFLYIRAVSDTLVEKIKTKINISMKRTLEWD